MQIDHTIRTAKPDSDFTKTLEESMAGYTRKLAVMLNGGLSFADNMNAQTIAVSFGTVDTEVAVAHALKKVPVGIFTTKIDKAASIYSSTTAWTATHIYLKCNVATVNATIIIH